MSEIKENELIILRSLREEWKSTKALIANNIELSDREETSLLLHGLKQDKFIKKASNGYWQLTIKGKSYLASHDGEPEEKSDEEVTIKTTEELLAEELESETPNLIGTFVEGLPPSPAPVVEQASQWSLVSNLMKELPDQTTFVVSGEGASIVVDGSEFHIEKEGDIEAVMRAASLYAGKVA